MITGISVGQSTLWNTQPVESILSTGAAQNCTILGRSFANLVNVKTFLRGNSCILVNLPISQVVMAYDFNLNTHEAEVGRSQSSRPAWFIE